MTNEVVCRYSSLIDEFVRIRVFRDDEIKELLQMKEAPTRRAYVQLVVTACVVESSEALLRKSDSTQPLEERDRIEEHFYSLAVEVNPNLDLRQVTIPMESETGEAELHLLPAPGLAANGSPETRLLRSLQKTAQNLEDEICKRVIGQAHAVSSVSKAIQKASVGLQDPRRPIGTFLFVGQTGVGKTELAKALTQCLFSDPARLLRVDCSEYSLPHEYAKLIGAPPGYIGHSEGGYLTDKASNGPCVLLFDEVEKAHTKVHNLLLQILDEGWLTDSKGNRVSFREALIILTSNLGVDRLQRYRNLMGFDTSQRREPDIELTREATLASLREAFRPEFINRIDEVVVFNRLSRRDCHKIVRNLLREISERAQGREISLVFTRKARSYLVEQGFSSEFGARELKRTLRELVENPLTERVLDQRIHSGSRVCVDRCGDEIVFRAAHGEAL